ncbi:MAG: beta-galactosidase, partial [Anaerolineales bacterium]|nr:beta-galactosidase [Anaerolineales bacterium]
MTAILKWRGVRASVPLLFISLSWLLLACQSNAPVPDASVEPAPTATPLWQDTPLNPLPADEMNLLFSSPAYGVHLSQWWDLEALERDMALTREMGFGWVKQKFAWRDIEGYEKGQYDWFRPDWIVDTAERHDLELVIRIDRQPLWSVRALPDSEIKNNQPPVDLADFGDFCGVLAERYAGRVAAYQIWNEPNLSREWGEKPPNPAEYTALLQ